MTLDLKWLLPFALPFPILILLRCLWWLSGGEWNEPGAAAFLSLVVGFFIGVVFAIYLDIDGIGWRVRIGKGQGDE